MAENGIDSGSHGVPLLSRPSATTLENGDAADPCTSKHTGKSTVIAYLHTSATFVGAGSFTMPWAFDRLGLVLGSVALAVIGFLSRRALGDLICAKGAAAARPSSAFNRSRKNVPSMGAPPPTAGLADLATEVLGTSAGCATRMLLIMRAVGTTAVHASLAAAMLRFAADPVCQRTGGALAEQREMWCQFRNHHSSTSVATVLLVVLPLLISLSPRRLAPLGIVGIIALIAVATIAIAAGALWQAEDDPLQGVPLFPHSVIRFADTFNVIVFLFCMHFAVLPSLADSMRSADSFSCMASVVFLVTVGLNIAIGLLGNQFLKGTMDKDINGPWPDVLITTAQVLLGIGNFALCPSVLVPAVEQTAVWFPRWLSCISLLGMTALLAQVGSFEQIASLVGGVQCVASLVLPPLLGFWVLPWQTRMQTIVRVGFVAAGLTVTMFSIPTTWNLFFPDLLPSLKAALEAALEKFHLHALPGNVTQGNLTQGNVTQGNLTQSLLPHVLAA